MACLGSYAWVVRVFEMPSRYRRAWNSHLQDIRVESRSGLAFWCVVTLSFCFFDCRYIHSHPVPVVYDGSMARGLPAQHAKLRENRVPFASRALCLTQYHFMISLYTLLLFVDMAY